MKVVRQVAFDPESVTIVFVDDSTDVRAEGAIYQTHTISIARGMELDDEIGELEEACKLLLVTAIADWAKSLPFDMTNALRQRDANLFDDDDDEDD